MSHTLDDYSQILETVDEALATQGRPSMLIARTTKGKGVSLMEDVAKWHGRPPGTGTIRMPESKEWECCLKSPEQGACEGALPAGTNSALDRPPPG